MNIIIIDGDFKFLKKFILDLKKINKLLTKDSFNIKSFHSSEEFLKFKKLKKIDLIIISIENIGVINGIEIAKIIRSNDLDIPMIFLSNSETFSMELHELRILDFILKSSDYYIRLKKCIKYLLRKRDIKKMKITYEYEEYSLEIDRILYIDSLGSKKIIKYYNPELISGGYKEFYYYTSFSQIKNKLLRNNFIQIRRSTYINKRYIFKKNSEVIKMDDGVEFFIGCTFKRYVNSLLSKL